MTSDEDQKRTGFLSDILKATAMTINCKEIGAGLGAARGLMNMHLQLYERHLRLCTQLYTELQEKDNRSVLNRLEREILDASQYIDFLQKNHSILEEILGPLGKETKEKLQELKTFATNYLQRY